MATQSLVTTQWVADHLDDPDVVLAEVDEDTTLYDTDHIPGAIAFHWREDFQDPVRRTFVGPRDFAALMERKGVSRDSHVVFYGGNNNWFAAFAFWYFRSYGHERLSLMDGGRKLWELENRTLTSAPPTRTVTSGYDPPALNESIRVRRDEVLERYVGSPDGVALVDVRSPAEYHGEIIAPERLPQESAMVAGHIPGAQNVPWEHVVHLETGQFRSADELRELYADVGATPDREVVTYCRVGERSSLAWFVLHELLEFPTVRNYDGSWTEYGSLIDVPVSRPAGGDEGGTA
ncbi:sulfurtransferase [Egibacter rhizosphaerae]|uniref:Sulfurtransferase n=1 Tax=Egibacter rhizosphaerae TaxID=1670831 RepID=A0A411YJB3_9ACTN|nr:sulfurtransferase [Egibacter rhizosphaerae]QBI21378.1 sulfurtransferase [Egibacter rhizosphaerae]